METLPAEMIVKIGAYIAAHGRKKDLIMFASTTTHNRMVIFSAFKTVLDHAKNFHWTLEILDSIQHNITLMPYYTCTNIKYIDYNHNKEYRLTYLIQLSGPMFVRSHVIKYSYGGRASTTYNSIAISEYNYANERPWHRYFANMDNVINFCNYNSEFIRAASKHRVHGIFENTTDYCSMSG